MFQIGTVTGLGNHCFGLVSRFHLVVLTCLRDRERAQPSGPAKVQTAGAALDSLANGRAQWPLNESLKYNWAASKSAFRRLGHPKRQESDHQSGPHLNAHLE